MVNSVRASTQGLEIVDRLRKQKGWTKYSVSWYDTALTSEATLRRFWRRVPIQSETFIQICQAVGAREEDVAESEELIATKCQDWGEAPDVPVFFGRAEELTTLEQWVLKDRCRLVAILGMGGIGKTQLSVKLGRGGIGKTDLSLELAKGIQDEFDYLIWRSLLNAPPVTDILTDLIKLLSDQKETDLPDTLNAQISLLIHYFREYRCLVILDNAESILQGGEGAGQYREGYQGYGELLRRVGEVPHQSCLLLTSREKPHEIALLEGKAKPVRSLNLSGLNESDGQRIFNEIGNFLGSDSEWKEVVEFYNGNPLALELAARHIEEVFFGDLSEFLSQGKPLFNDLRDLLDWHFERLSHDEKEIVYWLAINREQSSLSELREDILSPLAKEKVTSTLQSLQRLLPLEKTKAAFGLQPVILEYVTEGLINIACAEISEKNIEIINSHSLMKALAKDYVRESQSRLILQPIQDRLINSLGNKIGLETRLTEIISTLREKFPQRAGYVAGNILNLSRQLETDLRGQDFSHLTIWQAYLQGWNLPEVNFAGADLAKSVFTQAFGTVSAVAFSPDGRLLAAGIANGDIRLWGVADGEPLLTCRGHSDWPWAIAFSPDGRIVASGSQDQTVRLWDVSTGQCVLVLQGHTSWVKSVAFNCDGSLLASGSNDRAIRLWDTNTGQCLKILSEHSDWVWSVALSPDGRTLASGSGDGTIKLWDVTTGSCLQTINGHSNSVKAIAFSPDGNTLASGSFDQTVRLWNAKTGQCLKILQGHTEQVWLVAFNPDGRTLASSGDDGNIRLWDVNTGQVVKTVKERTNRIWSLAFSPDGNILASSGEDQTIRLRDSNTERTIKTIWGYSSVMWSVAFSPSDNIVGIGNDRGVQLWDIGTAKFLKTIQGYIGKTRAVSFSDRGSILASGSDDGNIRLWDLKTGQCLKTLQGHTNRVWSVAFSPDGNIAVSTSEDRTIRLWSVSTGQCQNTLTGHNSRVWSVAFSPHGQIFASGSDEEIVRLWDIKTGECIKTLQGHTSRVWSVAFSPNGNILASGSADRTVRLWNASTGECLATLEGHTNSVWSVAFSHKGNLLASAGTDRSVRLWDVETGQCLKVLEGHAEIIWSVAFSPDDRTLASSSSDETIKFWSVQAGQCVKTLRSDRPYERMNITGVTGVTEAQKAVLKDLGAIEDYTEIVT